MRVGLFIPCYIDQLYPDVGMATVEVLQRAGVEIDFPTAQTCCGQPMANTGCTHETRPLALRFLEIFGDYEHIVCPSGSCVAMVRRHYHDYLADQPGYDDLIGKTWELCEFLLDVLQIEHWEGRFPHRVGVHNACHGLRELRMGSCSEIVGPQFGKPQQLLGMLDGVELAELSRSDECCGFGGTFAVAEEAVSCMMGMDRVADHQQAEVDVITAADMSCLMHMSGLIRRNRIPLPTMHIAEILAGRPLPDLTNQQMAP